MSSQSPADLDGSILKRLQTRFVFALEKDQLRSISGVNADLNQRRIADRSQLQSVSEHGDGLLYFERLATGVPLPPLLIEVQFTDHPTQDDIGLEHFERELDEAWVRKVASERLSVISRRPAF